MKHAKLLFNQNNLLTAPDVDAYLSAICNQAHRYSTQQVREESFSHYHNLVIKHFDGIDPFQRITGIPLRYIYLEKHAVLSELGMDKSPAISPYTDFVSSKRLLDFLNLSADAVPLAYEKSLRKTKVESSFVLMGPLDSVSIFKDESKDWDLSYVATRLDTWNKFGQPLTLGKGIIVLHPEPLSFVEKTPEFHSMYKKLCRVASWFSHDLPGHATLDYMYGNSPERIALLYSTPEMKRIISPFINNSRSAYPARFCWEIGLLRLQASLFGQCAVQNPDVLTFLNQEIAEYKLLLQNALTKVDPSLLEKGRCYFLRLYAYFLTRLFRAEQYGIFIKDPEMEGHMRFFWKDNYQGFYLKQLSKQKGFPFLKNSHSRKITCDNQFQFEYVDIPQVFQIAKTGIDAMNASLSKRLVIAL